MLVDLHLGLVIPTGMTLFLSSWFPMPKLSFLLAFRLAYLCGMYPALASATSEESTASSLYLADLAPTQLKEQTDPASPAPTMRPAPQEALQRLLAGNARFVDDTLEHPNRTAERREAFLSHQEPFAVIVGCADSRVSPEILFDQGVGDLFVVRVAGNVIGPLELDSVDYAALYLHSSVILVLGHESCGAVDAVLHGKTKDIEHVAKLIAQSIDSVDQEPEADLLARSIKANAIRWKDHLLKSPVIQRLVKEGKLAVQAGYYHLQSGRVELLSP